MACRMILHPSCTTHSRLSPKMANQPSVIELICKERRHILFSVMETHSRQMLCTSVTVSKYGCYCRLCCKSHFKRVQNDSRARNLPKAPGKTRKHVSGRFLPLRAQNKLFLFGAKNWGWKQCFPCGKTRKHARYECFWKHVFLVSRAGILNKKQKLPSLSQSCLESRKTKGIYTNAHTKIKEYVVFSAF